MNAWQLTCCALAIPVVYAFEQHFYEAITVVSLGLTKLIATVTVGFGEGIMSPFTGGGPCRGIGECLAGLLFALIGVLLVLVLAVVIFLPVIAVVLALGVPFYAAKWLATHPGPPRYLLDLVLVWYVGLFFYGVAFPMLWRLLEPIVAHTLGELAFQRARARVYGARPRFTQPLYLAVAVVAIAGGGARVAAPISQTAATVAAEGWHDVSDPIFRPTPPEWPKQFAVPRGVSLPTGIAVSKNEELGFEAVADVFASVGTNRKWVPIKKNVAIRWGFAEAGELLLTSFAPDAVVSVYGPPQDNGRVWLLPGDVHKLAVQVEPGNLFYFCGAPDLSIRTTSPRGRSGWTPLADRTVCRTDEGTIGEHIPPPATIASRGSVEIKAGKQMAWFKFLTIRSKRR